MPFLPAEKSWRRLFFCAFAFFLLSRLLTLTAFPIFNDEAIYLQYAERIHADWAKNKFVSIDNAYGDWKPPLQYWLAAPVIRWGNDPLVAGRTVALLVSLGGFFGFYLFARELFGEREGVLTAALYALCPPVLFHNNEFIAETFLFSTAPFVYCAVLKAMRPEKFRWLWLIATLICSSAILLFKQSGTLLLVVAIFLPCARFRRGAGKDFLFNLLLVAAVIVLAKITAGLILPSEFGAARARFNSHWVMSAGELLKFPTAVWGANLRLVADYVGAYYSWLVPVFFGVFLWLAWRRKNLPEIALAAICLTSACAIIFLLRGFNEYLFNTAVIATLLPLLARTGVLVWELAPVGSLRLARAGFLAGAGMLLAFWSYQLVLMKIAPARYIERSTSWAEANYLRGWPTGFGIPDIVKMLEKEKRPGIIFADAQWGNPRTALEVYRDRFPNLRIVPISRAFLDRDQTRALREEARRTNAVRFAIFSADPAGRRPLWQENVEREMCAERAEIKAVSDQMPIVVCRF